MWLVLKVFNSGALCACLKEDKGIFEFMLWGLGLFRDAGGGWGFESGFGAWSVGYVSMGQRPSKNMTCGGDTVRSRHPARCFCQH